jgi:STE24 endopeptidase
MAEPDKQALLDKAKSYSRIKYTLAIADTLYLLALIVLFLDLGLSTALADFLAVIVNPGYLVFPAYLLVILVLSYLFTFPLNFYRSFILEHKFGLTKQKVSAWLVDQLKVGILSYLVGVILFGAFYYVLRHNPRTWWFIIALFWMCFSLLMAKILPVVIIPLFFKYKRLEDIVLRDRIVKLAEGMRVKILDVFEIDFSKKTLKANAAFVGWGKTRRVILADTLKDKYSYDEIEVILAHEFAHYRMKHLWKLISINAVTTLFLFYLIFITNAGFLNFFALASLENTAAFPLIIMYMTTFGIIMQPLENFLSRRFERNADIAALNATGMKEAFISMMDKLSDQNLADRNPHPVIKFFFFDHPPTAERISIAQSAIF